MSDDLRRVRSDTAGRYGTVRDGLKSTLRAMRTAGIENGVVLNREGQLTGLGSLILDQVFEHPDLGGSKTGTQLDLWGLDMDPTEHGEVVGSMIGQTPEARLGGFVFGALLAAETPYAVGIPQTFRTIGEPGEFTMPSDKWGVLKSCEPVQLYAMEIEPSVDGKSYSIY